MREYVTKNLVSEIIGLTPATGRKAPQGNVAAKKSEASRPQRTRFDVYFEGVNKSQVIACSNPLASWRRYPEYVRLLLTWQKCISERARRKGRVKKG